MIEVNSAEKLRFPERLVLPLSEYSVPNFRLDGLRKLQSVGAPIPSPTFVVSDDAFRLYKQSPEVLITQLEREIIEPANLAASLSNKGTISLRRAYDVPGEDNPRGPRFLGLNAGNMVESVINLFDVAIANKYDKPGAKIAGFFYPFIDPENKPLDEIQRHDLLPYGGLIVPVSADNTRFQVLATWGNNETVITYEREGRQVETYDCEIDPRHPGQVRIHRKHIVQKPDMHYTTPDGVNAIVSVPTSHQLETVMYDSEIVDVTKQIALLMAKYGPHKVEFSSNGESGIIFNEATSMDRELQGPENGFEREGTVFSINSVVDVDQLTRFSDQKLSEILIYTLATESGDSTNIHLAEVLKGKNLAVLYKGTSRTAHMMKLFNGAGFKAVATGAQAINEGDKVRVSVKDSVNNIENLTLNEIREGVLLKDAFKRGVEIVGPKADRLSSIKSKGFIVPDGIVLTVDFFDSVMSELGANVALEKILDNGSKDPDTIAQVMREAISHIPENVWDKIKPLLVRTNLVSADKKLIVRSSANVEDTRGQSFAGVFESIPCLGTEEAIKKAVLECLWSAYAPSVSHHLGVKKIEKLKEIKLPLIIQEMVDAEVSGTVFGGDPQTNDKGVILVEAKRGFARDIVDGVSVDERLILNKLTGKYLVREGEIILTKGQETSLFYLSELLEEEFKYPQDIEWSIDKNAKLWVLQSRDF